MTAENNKKKIAKIEVKPFYHEISKSVPISPINLISEGFTGDMKCELCGGKGYYQERKGGSVHTCLECLKKGRLNQN